MSAQDESLVSPDLEIESASPALISGSPTSNLQGPEIPDSILPSLSAANASATGVAKDPARKDSFQDSTEEFFGKPRKPSVDPELAGESLFDRPQAQLIQPRSRFSSSLADGLLSEQRRDSGEASPSFKFARSGSNTGKNSPALGYSGRSRTSSLASDTQHPRHPPKPFVNSALLNVNNSSAIAEDHEYSFPRSARNRAVSASHGPFDLSSGFMDDEEGIEGELAPYGGFSRADMGDLLLGRENIFEHAPWQIVRTDRGNGSLINAMGLAKEKGKVKDYKWVGTMSLPNDAIPEHRMKEIELFLDENYECESVALDDMTFQGHYKSFCKQILWPTLHYQIPDDPKSKVFEEHSFHFYKRANQLIADKIVATYEKLEKNRSPGEPQTMIWIHDYHLLLVPAMVREKCPHACIGFFLHVSFPSSEVFRCLAQRKALLEGMLGADCITFQTEEYVRHFLQTCNRLLLADTSKEGVIFHGKTTKVNYIPVGIDTASLEERCRTEEVRNWTKLIRDRWSKHTLIVSRDKLDKLRGIKQKLLAYEKFLHQHPKHLETTVLLQIFMGNASDPDYESEVMQIIARINSMAENISMAQPVVVLHQDIDFVQYLALQIEADLFVVSSMREGMNLTSHEFIVASSRKHSPLILSEFTGSSHLLDCKGRGALLVNPWDVYSFSERFAQAISMTMEERAERWKNCQKVVLTHDSMDWIEGCMASMKEGWGVNQENTAPGLKPFTEEAFSSFLKNCAGRKLFIINVDDLDTKADRASVSIELSRFAVILKDVIADPDNSIFFASILKRSELDSTFKNVPDVGLVAEFGAFIKFPNSETWIALDKDEHAKEWMPQVAQVFETKAETLTGAKAEVDDCTVRLMAHQAMAEDTKRTLDVLGDCVQLINDSFDSESLHATILHDSVIVQEKDISKQALKFLLSYYTTNTSVAGLTQRFKLKRVDSDSNILTARKNLSHSTGVRLPFEGRVASHVFYAGGLNPIDEDNYRDINSQGRNGVVGSTLTVAVRYGSTEGKTSANFSAAGQNELLGILAGEWQT